MFVPYNDFVGLEFGLTAAGFLASAFLGGIFLYYFIHTQIVTHVSFQSLGTS